MPRMRRPAWLAAAALLVLVLQPDAVHAQKKTLTVALNQDPDLLDPTLSRTYVGRIVFASMCITLRVERDCAFRRSRVQDPRSPTASDGDDNLRADVKSLTVRRGRRRGALSSIVTVR